MPNDMSGCEARLMTQLRKRAFKKQRGLCYWCKQPMHVGEPLNHPRQVSADHLKPRHAGGQTRADNIVAACRDCNQNRHPELNRGVMPVSDDGTVYSVGEPSRMSPFEVLKQN